MRLAIIDCDNLDDERRKPYISYPHMFVMAFDKAAKPVSYEVFSALDRQLPTEVDGFDGCLILGSRYGAYEDHAWISELRAFIRQWVDAGKKLAGICFGHQLIHAVLGGVVKKSERGWGIGVHDYQVYATPAWAKESHSHLSLIVSHQDQVEVAAPGSEVVAGSDFCPNAICVIGDRVFTCQPHPEFTQEYSQLLMTMRRTLIGNSLVDAGIASLKKETHSPHLLRWFYEFFEH